MSPRLASVLRQVRWALAVIVILFIVEVMLSSL